MRILLCNDYMPEALEAFRRALPAHEVVTCAESAVAESIAGVQVVIPGRAPLQADALAAATELRLIQQAGAGVDNVDRDEATRRGIPIATTPTHASGAGEAVAEFALFHLIGGGRNYPVMARSIAAGTMETSWGRSLHGSRVCVIGLGGIGKALVRLLKPFGCEVVGVKRTPDPALAAELGLTELFTADRLTDAVRDCPFVAAAVPLNDATEGLIGAEVLAAMPEDGVLVNVSRGPVVDQQALMDTLRAGRLWAVGLDVFWTEPMDPTDPLFDFDVLATPHAASACDRFLNGTGSIIADNVGRLERGEELLYTV